eukprot:TRINITY_DN3535_c0_g1_i14.p1 TRINITY_DN3535_c0_g1~~TRINITY_DN3535_c0_g1_i14.p1  ORF type:complete len:188 (-),score=9.30 TRINITY_DN3535_c0_g1_i14:262-825(-)
MPQNRLNIVQAKQSRVHKNNLGWQSFMGWIPQNRRGANIIENRLARNLSQSVELHMSEPFWMLEGIQFTHAYYTKGPNKVALNEGQAVSTQNSQDFLETDNVINCAQECSRVEDCNSFAFSPLQKRCYLKKVGNDLKGGPTKFNAGGFQTFWSTDKATEISRTCFCPCESELSCVLCDHYNKLCKEY